MSVCLWIQLVGRISGLEFGVFFGFAAGPIDYDFSISSCLPRRELGVIRIGEVLEPLRTRRTGSGRGEEADGGADGVAIGFLCQ